MDSLSQLALGSSIAVAVMGRRTAVWKAVLWGGVAGTLPDLDALVDFGDAVSNMVHHRAQSHGLFYLTLLAPVLAWLVSKLHGQGLLFKRWWLALWLALFTHPLLDWFTIYGTQLWQPFSSAPLGLGSMFIVDPLYTLPLLVGLVTALVSQRIGLFWNGVALGFSCVYLAWSAGAQMHVKTVVRETLATRGIAEAKFFVTPSPLNTVLWRVVVLRPQGFEEGYYSLLDKERSVRLDVFTSDTTLGEALKTKNDVQRMLAFTNGFVKLHEKDGKALLSDLRMGQEPHYVFAFALAEQDATQPNGWRDMKSVSAGERGDPKKFFAWLLPRLLGQQQTPPR
jgi:inner membrane protein